VKAVFVLYRAEMVNSRVWLLWKPHQCRSRSC